MKGKLQNILYVHGRHIENKTTAEKLEIYRCFEKNINESITVLWAEEVIKCYDSTTTRSINIAC
jgi:hypothetical protein